MASGEPTDPTVAVLAKVMGEMGFESGLIAEVTGVPRGTISDIVRGHNIWHLWHV
jgi:plasmid maintenance system antidote protein VapI